MCFFPCRTGSLTGRFALFTCGFGSILQHFLLLVTCRMVASTFCSLASWILDTRRFAAFLRRDVVLTVESTSMLRPAPSIHTSLATAVPSELGRTPSSCVMPGVFKYMLSNPAENALSAEPANQPGTF